MLDREKVIKGLETIRFNLRQMNNGFLADVCDDALALLKEQEEKLATMRMIYGTDAKVTGELVRCKDCDNKECWGRAGDVVCGIDGTPHRPDWFCADGERRTDDA